MDIHYDYDRFGCRHTLLSIVLPPLFSFLRVFSFLLCLSVLLRPLSPRLLYFFPFPFFLSPRFSLPLTSSKVLHVRVYVRSFSFPLVFFLFGAFRRRSRQLTGIVSVKGEPRSFRSDVIRDVRR